MIKIEYGVNNKEEKGKITLETDTKEEELLIEEIDTIKRLYLYMKSRHDIEKAREYLNNNLP